MRILLAVATVSLVLSAPAARAQSVEAVYHSGRVAVHYVTSGAAAPPSRDDDRDGTPDYVETIALAIDSAAADYERRGFRDVEQVAVYVGQLEPGEYGETVVSADGRPAVLIANGLRLNLLTITAAHELFHVVQLRYSARLDDWVAEGTAVEAARAMFPSVDDPARRTYERLWLREPGRSLDDADRACARCYGSSVWWRFVNQRWSSALPGLFEQLSQETASGAQPHSVVALAAALRGAGTTLRQAYAAFTSSLLTSTAKPRLAAARTLGRRPTLIEKRFARLSARYIPLRIPPGAFRLIVEVRGAVDVALSNRRGTRWLRTRSRPLVDGRDGTTVLLVVNGTTRPVRASVRLRLAR